MLLVDNIDNREFVCKLVQRMWEELPKKRRSKRGYREVDYIKIDTGHGDYLCADVMQKKAGKLFKET